MLSLVFTKLSSILSTGLNATAFSDTNFLFSGLTDNGAKERKIHDLALEKLQRARNEWNEERMKRLDFINKRLREKNEARAYMNNVDQAMLSTIEYLQKKIKPMPPEPQFSDFYHSSKDQKTGELLFVTVGKGIATYVLYKCLR